MVSLANFLVIIHSLATNNICFIWWSNIPMSDFRRLKRTILHEFSLSREEKKPDMFIRQTIDTELVVIECI